MKTRTVPPENVRIARLLRALASLIERSSSDEWETLLAGRGGTGHLSEKLRRGTPNYKHAFNPDRLIRELGLLRSRDDGISLLATAQLTRRELESLARRLGLAFLKSDNIERLEEKIIEGSIGARLGSEAVRGEHLKVGE
jgi:hypothetical protein